MKRLFKFLLPLAVLGICAAIGVHLIRTAPESKRKSPKPMIPVVETLTAQPVDYSIMVRSRGTISPRTQGALVAEVEGRILQTADNFRPGGFFEIGDLLTTLDPTDYQHALTIAQAELAQSRLTLKEEQAKGLQAKQDWKKMGLAGAPGDLTLRTPQLQRVRATLAASQARLAQAQRNLERTRIVAPYAGRVLSKQVGVGQYITRGATLATLYAVDYAEVRLPITDAQAQFLTLPERYRGDRGAIAGPKVSLSAVVAAATYEWQGQVMRTEGTIDLRTRQIHVVAQIDDPYGRATVGRPPLKVGQFVKAKIQGRTLSRVYLVPRDAFRHAGEILLLTADSRIQRRQVRTVWKDGENTVVMSGISSGDRIVLTPLPYAPDGMLVADGAQSTPQQPSKKKPKQRRER